MWLPWLRSDRAAVISACALAVNRERPLAETLDQVAAGDPLLRPWARRLGPALRSGEQLSPVLRRHRLLSRDQAQWCAAAEAAAALPVVLPTLARHFPTTAPLLWLWRWFPTWVALAIVTGLIYLHAIIEVMAGPVFRSLYSELGIELDGFSVLVFHWPMWHGVVAGTAAVVMVWMIQMVLSRIPATGILRLVGGWSLERKRLAVLLLHYGMIAEAAQRSGVSLPRSQWRWHLHWYKLSLLGILKWEQMQEADDCDDDDLVGQLVILGVVQRHHETIDWASAVAIAVTELKQTAHRTGLFIALILVVLIGYCFIRAAFEGTAGALRWMG